MNIPQLTYRKLGIWHLDFGNVKGKVYLRFIAICHSYQFGTWKCFWQITIHIFHFVIYIASKFSQGIILLHTNHTGCSFLLLFSKIRCYIHEGDDIEGIQFLLSFEWEMYLYVIHVTSSLWNKLHFSFHTEIKNLQIWILHLIEPI